MKTFFLRSAAAAALIAAAGSAFAADLPRRDILAAPAPVTVAAPLFSWSGFYVGLNAGYHFRDNDATTVGTPAFVGLGAAVPGSLSVGKDGFIGGGQIGWNQQYGSLVVGIETDIQWIDGGRRGTAFITPGVITTQASSRMSYLGTLRGRVGFLASDRLMLYVTGGLAYGNPRNEAFVTTPIGQAWAGSSNSTRAGWTVGGGAEYAFTNNITAKIEYLYYDLGRTTVTATQFAGPVVPGVAYQARFENTGQLVRAGVNFKF